MTSETPEGLVESPPMSIAYGAPAPPRTECNFTVNAKGDYQWTFELDCTPGDEAAMLDLLDRMNARIAAQYRPEVHRLPPTPMKRVADALEAFATGLRDEETSEFVVRFLSDLGFVQRDVAEVASGAVVA